MVLLDALQASLSIIFMMVIGYFLSYKGWFDSQNSKLLSKLVVNISLPAYMISNLIGTYNKDKLLNIWKGALIPFVSMILCFGIAICVARLIKIAPNRRGTFCSMFALSNTIFVGLPVNLALFGEESVSFVLLYYIANTTLFWTIGVYSISRDGSSKKKERLFSVNSLKRIFSPPLMGFITAVVLILLGVKLPKGILDTCKYLGNLTTPLSMFFIGFVIYSVKLRSIRFDKSIITVLFGRFIISPIMVVLMIFIVPFLSAIPFISVESFPILMKNVFFIQSFMPAMTQTSIIAQVYDADYEYAAVATTLTTVFSLALIPLYMFLLSSGFIFK